MAITKIMTLIIYNYYVLIVMLKLATIVVKILSTITINKLMSNLL